MVFAVLWQDVLKPIKVIQFTEQLQQGAIKTATTTKQEFSRHHTSHAGQQEIAKDQYNNTALKCIE